MFLDLDGSRISRPQDVAASKGKPQGWIGPSPPASDSAKSTFIASCHRPHRYTREGVNGTWREDKSFNCATGKSTTYGYGSNNDLNGAEVMFQDCLSQRPPWTTRRQKEEALRREEEQKKKHASHELTIPKPVLGGIRADRRGIANDRYDLATSTSKNVLKFHEPVEEPKKLTKSNTFTNLLHRSNKSSGNLISSLLMNKSNPDLAHVHRKNKSTSNVLRRSKSRATIGVVASNELKGLQLTSLRSLIDQSFIDLEGYKMIHAAQSKGSEVKGISLLNGGEKLVANDGTIMNFEEMEHNLKNFRDFYDEFLQHGGTDPLIGEWGLPGKEIYLLSSVTTSSTVYKTKLTTAEGVPKTRVPDCGL